MYLPKRSGIDAIGENTNISVLTLQPCLNTYSSDINEYLSLPDLSAEKISGNLPLYTFRAENNYDNQEVTLNLIKALSENQVIIWHGHGGYSNSLHSYLLTGEEFDWDAWWQNPIYCLDSLQNRIIECSNGNVAFTSKYVDKYCNNLNGTFLYLAACQSGKDNVLVDSFLGKGAEAVVANSETIYTVYNLQIQSATLNNMTQYNEKTGNLYTLEEALAMAKKEFGENDSAYGDKEEIATPLIFGGQDAENFVFHNDATSVKSKQIHYDAVEFNGHYYFLYENTNVASYNDALEYCINNGGYLATITSQEENDFVYSYIKRLGCESAYFGLSNASSEGNWQWCTGENLSYTAWHSGEPNTENSNEDYAMFYYKYNDGSWNDGDFGESTINGGNSFICEWGDYALDSGDNKMSESEKTTCVEAEELYADILDRFYYHIKSEWSTYDLEKEQDDISYLYSLYYEVYDDPKYIDNIGYSFLDLNEDGIPELLIGVYDANINKFRCSDNIYDLYTYEDGKIVHLESITGRNDCNLCDDNTIIRKDEAGYESMEYYHLCLESGEHALSIMEYVYCNFDSNSQKAYWFYETPELSNLIKDEKDKSTPISEVEANNILENWPKTIEFALTMFSSYTPKKSKTTDIPIAKINAFDLIGKDISYISDMYGEDYIDTYYALGGKCYLYEDLETLFIYDDMGKVLIVVGWHDTDYGYNLSGTTTYPDLVSKMESNNIELPLPQYGCFVYPSYYIVEFELNGYIIDYFWEDDPNISDSCEIWIHQWKSQLGHAE